VLAEEGNAIVRICQLVEGMPLALELAAVWTKMLCCFAIAAEIQQNLNFLTTRLRDIPDRHRSIQAVFEHSWRLLTTREQEVFMRLCVFRGGFTLEAATVVADASPALLAGLVDKSLAYQTSGSRYNVHELLRQFAQSKLEELPQQLMQTKDRHCAYYANYLYARQSDMTGKRQYEAMSEIDAELDNVRATLQWAVDTNRLSELIHAVQTYSQFSQFRSNYQESTYVLEKMLATFDGGDDSDDDSDDLTQEKQIGLILVTIYLGWVYIRMGKIEAAEVVVQRCRALYSQLAIAPLPGNTTDPDAPLGVICLIKGEYSKATVLGEASLQRNSRHGHQRNRQLAAYVLTSAALAQGQYVQAQQHAQQTYAIAQAIGDQWFMAHCLNALGQVDEALGSHTTAAQYFVASYQLREKFNDLGGMAAALAHLGQNALLQNNYTEAQTLYAKSQLFYQEINDRGGMATALKGLGATAHATGDYLTACRHFREALQLAADVQFVPVSLSLFIHSGALFLQTGNPEQGLSLLRFVLHHPASERAAKERATHMLSAYQAQVAPAICASAAEAQPHHALKSKIAQLLLDLTVVENSLQESSASIEPSPLSPQQGLSEPLTQREIEVLALLAQDMTNQQIAQQMIVSVGAVKAHNHSIYSKLGVNNRQLAVARAREIRLL
jgi:DNA-binding NarL/FixJ family response regulator